MGKEEWSKYPCQQPKHEIELYVPNSNGVHSLALMLSTCMSREVLLAFIAFITDRTLVVHKLDGTESTAAHCSNHCF